MTVERPANAPRRTWWRTNAVALIALAVLLPGGFAVLAGDNVATLLSNQAVVRPAALAAGEQHTVDDITIGAVSFTTLTDVEGAPQNGSVIVARIAIERAAASSTTPAAICTILRLVSATGDEWEAVDLGLADLAEDEYRYCGTAPRSTLISSFLVADGTQGPFAVDILVTRESGTEVIRVTDG